MGRVRLTRPFVLLALAALLAPRAEASRTRVWESNPPVAFSVARTEAASALASLVPAARLDASAQPDAEAAEQQSFNFGDVVLADTADADAERFDLGPLTLVDLNLLRGPPPSYPETRVRGFELLPSFRVGASPTLSLWPRRACGSISCGLVSDSPEDPWGLEIGESAPGTVNRILDWLAETPVGRGAGWVGDKIGELSSLLGMWGGQEAGKPFAPKTGIDPQVADLHDASEMPESRGMQSGMQPGRSLKVGLQRDAADVAEAAVTNAVEQGAYWAGAGVLRRATETLQDASQVLREAEVPKPRRGLTWEGENAWMPKRARTYQEGATGARSSLATGKAQSPTLHYDNPFGGKNMVRFDGLDGTTLIDRKISTYSTPKARLAARRQAEALNQNKMMGRWEVPTESEVRRARRILAEENVTNIVVKLVLER
jgi:hypothetical protein